MSERILHTGEGRILVGLTLDELDELAGATTSLEMRARLLVAIGLLDPEREMRVRRELDSADDGSLEKVDPASQGAT